MAIPTRNRPDYDYSRYVLEHGTQTEIAKLREEVLFMRDLHKAFPGSSWEPMEQVVLIDHLIDRATRIAARRMDAAKLLPRPPGQTGRAIVEERAAVRAQLAVRSCPAAMGNRTRIRRPEVGNCGAGHGPLPLFNP
jgi:hypothetical protein